MKQKYLVVILLISILSGCGLDLDDAGKGSISGSVSDATTGEPVSVVNVVLNPGGVSTVTGSDGRFQFDDIASGSYTIEVTKEHYSSVSQVVNVETGKVTQSHILIEREAARLTSDKEELDFSKNLNTLSFNIVNRGYEDLTLEIEVGNCKWLAVNPKSAILKSGKTLTIVATIDRNLLEEDENTASIIVKSTNGGGNVEINVKAWGERRVAAVVTTGDITDITDSSVVLNGETTNGGTPNYTERGFEISTDKDFIENKTIKIKSETPSYNKAFIVKAEDLDFYTKYYARAYVIWCDKVIYGNTKTFTTNGLEPDIQTLDATDVECWGDNGYNYKMTMHAVVYDEGNPPYTIRGFCYTFGNGDKYHETPTIENEHVIVDGSGKGNYDITVSGIKPSMHDYLIKVRAYVIQGGRAIYSNNIKMVTVTNR